MADRVGQQIGNYRISRLLGKGGQAEVYLGEHIYLNSPAALKVLHASLAADQVERFLAEARMLVHLIHPTIVRVLDFVVEQGTPILIMDYAAEGTARTRHPLGSRIPLPRVVSYVKYVAAALQYAHMHNVIHRDVKPENLLLGRADQLLLSDFGLALLAPSPELLSTQELAGTLPYMAPEQLRGKPCFASDQYALGIVVYEWLCGSRPFTGGFGRLVEQHLYEDPPPLREKNAALPEAVEAVILKALAKDPRERYVSVQSFSHALAHASQERLREREQRAEEVRRRQEQQLQKRYTRRTVLVGATGVGLAIAAAATAGVLVRQVSQPSSPAPSRPSSSFSVPTHPSPSFSAPTRLVLTVAFAGPLEAGMSLLLQGRGFSANGRVTLTHDTVFFCQPNAVSADGHGTFLVEIVVGADASWEPGPHAITAYDTVSKHSALTTIVLAANPTGRR